MKKEEKDFEKPVVFETAFTKNRVSDGPSSRLFKDTGDKEFHHSIDKSLSRKTFDISFMF